MENVLSKLLAVSNYTPPLMPDQIVRKAALMDLEKPRLMSEQVGDVPIMVLSRQA